MDKFEEKNELQENYKTCTITNSSDERKTKNLCSRRKWSDVPRICFEDLPDSPASPDPECRFPEPEYHSKNIPLERQVFSEPLYEYQFPESPDDNSWTSLNYIEYSKYDSPVHTTSDNTFIDVNSNPEEYTRKTTSESLDQFSDLEKQPFFVPPVAKSREKYSSPEPEGYYPEKCFSNNTPEDSDYSENFKSQWRFEENKNLPFSYFNENNNFSEFPKEYIDPHPWGPEINYPPQPEFPLNDSGIIRDENFPRYWIPIERYSYVGKPRPVLPISSFYNEDTVYRNPGKQNEKAPKVDWKEPFEYSTSKFLKPEPNYEVETENVEDADIPWRVPKYRIFETSFILNPPSDSSEETDTASEVSDSENSIHVDWMPIDANEPTEPSFSKNLDSAFKDLEIAGQCNLKNRSLDSFRSSSPQPDFETMDDSDKFPRTSSPVKRQYEGNLLRTESEIYQYNNFRINLQNGALKLKLRGTQNLNDSFVCGHLNMSDYIPEISYNLCVPFNNCIVNMMLNGLPSLICIQHGDTNNPRNINCNCIPICNCRANAARSNLSNRPISISSANDPTVRIYTG